MDTSIEVDYNMVYIVVIVKERRCTFTLHYKPPFGCHTLLVDTTIYALKKRLVF